MKKILILLAVVGLTFTSCYQDEYEAPNGGATAKKAYFSTDQETVALSATAYDVTVNFTAAFSNDVLLSYTLDGTPMQMTVSAGSTSATLASVDISASGSSHNVVLNAIASNSESVAIDDDRKDFTVIVPYAANPGNLRIILRWNDSSRDLDPRIKTGANNTGTTIDGSYGSTTTEIVDFPETTADGMYYYYINEFAFTADVDITVYFVEPDGTNHVFNMVVHNDSDVMTFTKTTDAGTGAITYAYTVL
jgi:hypothetical protein